MSIDLRANPFCLSDAQIGWVQDTLASMSEDEKIGQLFLPIAFSSDENYLRYEMLRYHVGGLLFKTSPSGEVRQALQFMQNNSRIPLLCAANLEFGSTGFLEDGTLFGQQLGIGATGDAKHAYRMGYVSCKEAAAAGCNFAFAPVSDLDLKTMWLCPSSIFQAMEWTRWTSICWSASTPCPSTNGKQPTARCTAV